jgi:putative FmdB family regulatory protein
LPTYSYKCTECGTAFDIQQAFADDSLTVCPSCGGKLRKVFTAVGVTFNGSGFYRNDSRSTGSSSDSSGASGSHSKSGEGKSSEGKSADGKSSEGTSSGGKSPDSKPSESTSAASAPSTPAPPSTKAAG